MSYKEECIRKFNKLPTELIKLITSEKNMAFLEDLRIQYNADLRFLIILFFTFELKIEEIDEYLIKKFGFSKDLAVKIKNRLVFELIIPVAEKFDDKIQDWENEELLNRKKEMINIFESKLIATIKASPAKQQDFNNNLIELLKEFPGIERILAVKMMENKEKLSHQHFQINNKTMRPTIGNWIHYLIENLGSDNFDNIMLSKFMIGASNIKILSSKEKALLLKIFRLYRNVSFYREIKETQHQREPEFLPIDSRNVKVHTGKHIKEDSVLVKLNEMLDRFAAGTLERKAIEEEINKIKN